MNLVLVVRYGLQGIVQRQNLCSEMVSSGSFQGKENDFYKNLENNISNGAPTDAFLWPKAITKVYNDQFGYLMDVRPSGYEELTNFFVGGRKQKQARFKSFYALCTAAINIIEAFRALHNNGYSYQDINNGNFFINPENGDVLICDNDNVSPFGTNLGIMGKQRWMAPKLLWVRMTRTRTATGSVWQWYCSGCCLSITRWKAVIVHLLV